MNKKTRVFVGIPVSKNLQKEIDKFLKDNFQGFSIKIIKPKNLHITVIPPWYSENLNKEKQNLRKVGKKAVPFSLKIKNVSFGPNPMKPRLIWATGERNEEITSLRDKVFEVFETSLPKRIFIPHVTMARYKRSDYKQFPVKKFDKRVEWNMLIDKVFLYQSILKKGGAEYKVLERVKL